MVAEPEITRLVAEFEEGLRTKLACDVQVKMDTRRDLTNWKIVSSKSSTVCQKWNCGYISDLWVLVT